MIFTRHRYVGGETLVTCETHVDCAGDYSATGAAYAGFAVLLAGTCEICAALAACFSGPLFGGGAHYTYAGDTSTATFFQEPPDIHGQPVFTRHRDDAAVQDSPTGDSP